MNVAVLGLGLIGGSVLQALAAGGHRVVGFDADPATRATARTAAARARTGTRWEVAGTVRDALAGTDLCVLAVPFPALPSVRRELDGYLGLVTDVTSIKGPVRELMGGLRFVGGHPMAGKETSGFRAADRGLFVGCAWVLGLEPETETADWLELAALVTGLGARVVPATAAEHDRAVAGVSHVPHLLAAALTGAIENDPLAAALAAGSFRDGTRVAATRPELIAAMCGGNAAAVGEALDEVIHTLRALRTQLSEPDPVAALRPLLAPANATRSAWPPVPGDQAELPARKDVLLRLGRVGGWVIGVDRPHRKVTAMRPETDRNPS
ncbi:prephenate dehydrogenase [Actinoplanes sp. NPDC049265]|uniref:prephenate dehydrogenase n=1 Tax=Actinoplanes sp. NPDC049265 TaxID=3363902 RepID=UPI0037199F76